MCSASRRARGAVRRGAATGPASGAGTRGPPPPGALDGSREAAGGEPLPGGDFPQTRYEREKRNKAPEREREKNGKIVKTNKQKRTSAKLSSPGDPASTPRRGPSRGEAAEGAEERAAPRARTAPPRSADLGEGCWASPVLRQRSGEERWEAGSAPDSLFLLSPRLCGDLGQGGAGGYKIGGQF